MRPRRAWRARLLGTGRAILGVALLVYVLRWSGAGGALATLVLTPWLLALVGGVPVVGAALEAGRLAVLFRALGMQLPLGVGYRVVAIGSLFNLWIPGGTGGDVVKLYYLLARYSDRKLEVTVLLLADRALGLAALLALLLALLAAQPTLLALPVVLALAWSMAAVLGVLVMGAAVLASTRVRHAPIVRRIAARLPLGAHLARATSVARRLFDRPGAIAVALALSLGGHLLLTATLMVVARELLPRLSELAAATLALVALAANALPLTPGGMGVGEAAAEALVRAAGEGGGAALVAAWRAGTVVIGIVGAVLYAAGVRRARGAEPGGVRSESAAAGTR